LKSDNGQVLNLRIFMEHPILSHLRSLYRVLTRPQREKLMCAMIRINYGTSWPGDEERARHFLPEDLHRRLHLNGLNDVIESLCPISDEPTDPAYRSEPTTHRIVSADSSRTANKAPSNS
jgi:hypothetical protein